MPAQEGRDLGREESVQGVEGVRYDMGKEWNCHHDSKVEAHQAWRICKYRIHSTHST